MYINGIYLRRQLRPRGGNLINKSKHGYDIETIFITTIENHVHKVEIRKFLKIYLNI